MNDLLCFVSGGTEGLQAGPVTFLSLPWSPEVTTHKCIFMHHLLKSCLTTHTHKLGTFSYVCTTDKIICHLNAKKELTKCLLRKFVLVMG